MLKTLLDWDRDTFIYLNNLGSEGYDFFWLTITDFVTWTPLFLLFILLIFVKHKKREGIFILLTIVVMLVFISLFIHFTKINVARLRPNNAADLYQLIRILRNPSTFSFFSGHAASSFAITTIVIAFLKDRFKWVWIFYTWPILFAMSRIFVGVHYPLDLIVGTLVGVFVALAFYQTHKKFIVPYLTLNRP